MVRKKVQIPNVVRGGIAIPLNKDNMYLMRGRKHSQGGIDIGNNPRTGMEVEDGEIMQLTNKGAKVFSAMPFLNGQSPADKVLNGQNPNKVFNNQENFKKRNNINNDGTQSRKKAATGIFDTLDEYADKGEGIISAANLASSGAALVAPNPVTLGAAYLTNLGGAAIDIYQLGRSLYKGDTAAAIKNGAEIGLSLVGARALKNFKKLNALDKYKKLNGIPQQQIVKKVGRRRPVTTTLTKENVDATNQLVKSVGAQGTAGMSSIFIDEDKIKKNNQQNNTNKYRTGGYRSSNNIRRRIAKMEGSSMKTNRSFDLEDRDFYNAIPGNVRKNLNQEALDNLYSYSYNVGAGNFKKRVVPALTALTNGTGTVKDVQNSMWASKDKQLRGLRIRRNIERQGFADAYNKYNNINNTLANTQSMINNIQDKIELPAIKQDNTYVQKPITIKSIEMPKKQKKYNNEFIKLGMDMLNNKVKYNSTFAAGGRKNLSTGKYSQNNSVSKRNNASNSNNKKQSTQSPAQNNTKNNASANNNPNIDTVTQKNIDALNKMRKDNNDFSNKFNALSKNQQFYVLAGKNKEDINKRLNDSYYKNPNNYIANRNSISPFVRNNDKFDIKTDAANLSNRINTDMRHKAMINYNRSKINKSDAIGLASNVLGSITSGIINDRMLSSMKYPSAPVRTTAAKLKTNYNINPQLDTLRENLYNVYQDINNSTNSSQLALARRQRYAFNNTLAANSLYGNKENQQAQLINQDRLNQQQNSANNIAAYNQWNQNKAAFDNNIIEKRAENSVGILQNINAGVQDVLARREQRQHDNNTIKAMIAANPNVTPEYFNHFGLNLYRFGGKRFNRR